MKNSTQIAIILDRSGSMAIIRAATEEMFNNFIDNQKTDVNEVKILFVQFDTDAPHEVVYDGDVKTAPKLEFHPRGGTPLHDAMGWTITELGKRLASLPEAERPDKVMVVILTDGHENASREFTGATVAALVKEQTEVYKWQFIFLAANQDAVLTAKTYNILEQCALTYNTNAASMRSGTGALTFVTDMWKYSEGTITPEFTEEDRKNAQQ